MSLFQKSVLKHYLSNLDSVTVGERYEKYKAFFYNLQIQQTIKESKEEEFQYRFLQELFVNVLGYIIKPDEKYNLVVEQKNESDSKKADGAVVINDKVTTVIELKGANTVDLNKIQYQAFGYLSAQPDAMYVVTSNFVKLRFYIQKSNEYEEFNLFNLTYSEFEVLWLCLAYENIKQGLPLKIKNESIIEEENITKQLYKDYSSFKNELFRSIVKLNPQYDKLTLFKASQKLIDRFLFVFFCEDNNGLLPANSIAEIINHWIKMRDEMDEYRPLYDTFKKYFEYINTGRSATATKQEIYAYNGGLFSSDELLDNLTIDDTVLYTHTQKISKYDFVSEVDVNILGHIFENSLNDIEQVQAEIEGVTLDSNKTKRKKDGVFYTPKYITQYIVENTIGKLCADKKESLDMDEDKFTKAKSTASRKPLLDKLNTYKQYLLSLTICDPACGSGAFLNQAFVYLLAEHQYVAELESKLFDAPMQVSDVTADILERNLYGVDINEESVEIAKLSLWLRTAKKGRKLNSLSNNIKCGNSLIDDPEVAGDKAFNWEKEFPHVFAKGGFDVVVGNPPYLRIQGLIDAYPEMVDYYNSNYHAATSNYDIYVLFIERIYSLINPNGIISFILPHKFLISDFGVGIRKFLSERRAVSNLLHFEENLVFEVTTYTCIVNITRTINEQLYFKYIDPKNILNPFTWSQMNVNRLTESNWNLMDETKSRLFDKLYNNPNTLKDVFSKIFTGLQTSADKIYLIDGYVEGNYIKGYSTSLEREVIIEKEFVKPLLKGQDVNRYAPLVNNYFVIFPYLIENGKAMSMDISYISENFPLGYQYLKENEEELRGREKGRMDKEGWFLYIYPKSLAEFEQIKLITPEISLGCNLTFDVKGSIYHNTKCYSFILKKPSIQRYKYYLAILNSNILWYFLSSTGYVLRGGYFTFKTNYLFPFPIPREPQSLLIYENLVDEVLQIKDNEVILLEKFYNRLKSSLNANITKNLSNFYQDGFSNILGELKKQKIKLTLIEQDEWEEYFNTYKSEIQKIHTDLEIVESKINQMVYELYGLTDEEIKIVEENG